MAALVKAPPFLCPNKNAPTYTRTGRTMETKGYQSNNSSCSNISSVVGSISVHAAHSWCPLLLKICGTAFCPTMADWSREYKGIYLITKYPSTSFPVAFALALNRKLSAFIFSSC